MGVLVGALVSLARTVAGKAIADFRGLQRIGDDGSGGP